MVSMAAKDLFCICNYLSYKSHIICDFSLYQETYPILRPTKTKLNIFIEMSGKWLLFFKLGSLWSWKLSSTAGNWYSPLLKLSNSTCFYLTSALRAQVKHMTDCKRKSSLFINARCSVNLQVLAFEANPRSLFSFHRDRNDALGQASFFTPLSQCSVKLCLHSQVLPDSCQFEGPAPGSTQSWDQSSSPGR